MAATLLCTRLTVSRLTGLQGRHTVPRCWQVTNLLAKTLTQTASRSPCYSCWYPVASPLNHRFTSAVVMILRRPFHQSLILSARPKANKFPFEVNHSVPKDTLIFSCENTRFFKLMTLFGIVQFFFWANLASFSYSGFQQMSENEAMKEAIGPESGSFGSYLFVFQNKHSNKIAAMCIAFGVMVSFFTWFFPQRSIRQIYLLAGGQDLHITTYSHFGRTKSFTVPLQNVSCQHGRKSDAGQLSLKLKGKWFYFLMDKRKGTFHQPTLFDHVVGLKRNI